MWRFLFVVPLGLLLVAVCSPGAFSEEAAASSHEQELLEMVKRLEQRVTDLEAQLRQQQPSAVPAEAAQPAAADATPKAETAAAPAAQTGSNDLQARWKNGLSFESADKQFRLKLGGRLQADAAFFDQDEDLRWAVGKEQDSAEFRSARINLEGQMYGNIIYRAEYEFEGDGAGKFRDVYAGITGLPAVGNLKLGHFREPFGFERLMNPLNTVFMERALPNVFTPDRNIGAMFYDAPLEERMTWAVGVFKETDDFPSSNDADVDQGYTFTGRVTGLPWYKEDGRKLLHLGLAYSHRNPDGAVPDYRTRPEAHLARRYVNPQGFPSFRLQDAHVDDVDLLGTEALFLYGPFGLQGEYIQSYVDTLFAGDLDFGGYYVQANYFLTGEQRQYKTADGLFGRLIPKHNFSLGEDGGWGAWELAARYSAVDVDDGPVRGGTEENLTFGVNWYLNPNTRIMWNYVHAMIEHDLYEGDLDILQTRVQVDF
ncbi:MAG TPA: porin [Candidatus Hydrogenedentes bacterium]|nr:porin [Candidatus Hydrogenedentota bacterium]HPG69609.1 porin [Candidatus Hydrogenedentota bacterium]